jgi:hypothetical protein
VVPCVGVGGVFVLAGKLPSALPGCGALGDFGGTVRWW